MVDLNMIIGRDAEKGENRLVIVFLWKVSDEYGVKGIRTSFLKS